MNLRFFSTALTLLGLLCLGVVAAQDELSEIAPLSAEQIADLGIREADVASRDLPGYRKLERILVMSAGFPGLSEALEAAAPEVEFDIFMEGGRDTYPANNYDAVVVFNNQSDAVNTSLSLAWVHTYSAGVDKLLTQPAVAGQRPILTNGSGTTSAAIAEHAIGMMFTHARQFHRFRDSQNHGRWDRRGIHTGPQWSVSGKTMLVLGLGAIGSQIARRADVLGMRVIAVRNSSRAGPAYVDYVGLSDEALDLAAEADVIVNALPLTSATRGMIDKGFFDAMKPSAILLSIGRGPTIVTNDLLEALREGRIAGAGLDVTDPEPLPPDHPLWFEPRAIITPHVSSGGSDPLIRFGLLVENVRRYQAGEPLLNPVDIDAGY